MNLKIKPKDEKWTPLKYLKSIRKVLGHIDLDPFSSEAANERVKASAIFTINDDAYRKDWFGKVFTNPPYSRGNLNRATNKICLEFEKGNVSEAIYLVPNSTDVNWFKELWNFPICFTDHRICFINGYSIKPKIEKNPENGSCFVYFGTSALAFIEEFEKWGHIVRPIFN